RSRLPAVGKGDKPVMTLTVPCTFVPNKKSAPFSCTLFVPSRLTERPFFFPQRVHKRFPLSWWAHLGSNQGPTGYEPVALPAELWAHPYYMPSLKGVNPNSNADWGL